MCADREPIRRDEPGPDQIDDDERERHRSLQGTTPPCYRAAVRYHAALPDRACGALIATHGRSVARRDAIYSDSRCACSLCPCAVLHGRDTPERPRGTSCEP